MGNYGSDLWPAFPICPTPGRKTEKAGGDPTIILQGRGSPSDVTQVSGFLSVLVILGGDGCPLHHRFVVMMI